MQTPCKICSIVLGVMARLRCAWCDDYMSLVVTPSTIGFVDPQLLIQESGRSCIKVDDGRDHEDLRLCADLNVFQVSFRVLSVSIQLFMVFGPKHIHFYFASAPPLVFQG